MMPLPLSTSHLRTTQAKRRGPSRLMLTAGLAIVLAGGPYAVASQESKASIVVSEADLQAASIGDGLIRFHASPADKARALPSLALQRQFTDEAAGSTATSIIPVFSRVEVEGKIRHRAVVKTPEGTSFYGTGEVAGPLLRNGRVIECWNTDAYGYGDDAKSLYKSHPWVLGVRPDGTAFGVLADTTYRCEVDLRREVGGIQFTADTSFNPYVSRIGAQVGPAFPVIVIDPKNGKGTPQDVMRALGELVGTIAMPPKWAIGYHQCRYSYFPDTRVMEVARTFREKKIPCDVIWHDIDYMDGFRCFTWDKKHFPDPTRHNSDLHKIGFKTVWMIDPGIKAEDGYFVSDQMMAGNHSVLRADGTVYQGEVWPGMCIFPDYTRRETREWWAGLYKNFMATGVDGVWNDMNEPAVFNVKTKTMPEDNLHRADADLGGPGSHARYHNVYGMFMIKATREGIIAANPEKRPFVLSRASYIGGHRYGASWTGDNTANWYHLETSIPMTLNVGLSGQPFAGPDIGGFAGNGDGPLFARWMGFGALMPFSRGHTGKENIDKEPWSFGVKVEATSREALERRYRLLPYFYTLFHEAAETGMPVMRPAFFADPSDPALRSEDDTFLIGQDLLVVPQVVPDRTRVPVMPRGEWVEIDEFKSQDPDQPRLFQRAGSIIPIAQVMQHVGEQPLELTLLIVPDANGDASGVMYDDAGEGLAYSTGGFRLSRFQAITEGDEVSVREASSQGNLPPTWATISAKVQGGIARKTSMQAPPAK
jgi:alpha-glucosidase